MAIGFRSRYYSPTYYLLESAPVTPQLVLAFTPRGPRGLKFVVTRRGAFNQGVIPVGAVTPAASPVPIYQIGPYGSFF